jgi:ABC-type multidrug transport system fused ATPase/permease subunit
MLDRFYYQIYLGTAEPLVKQFRFSKYLLLTSVKSLFVVLFIPFFINILTKIYIFRPLVEYFWDTKQTEIFLNYELQEKAFTEIRNFEEKIYFDHLLKMSEERRDERERTTSFLSNSFSLSPARFSFNLRDETRLREVEQQSDSFAFLYSSVLSISPISPYFGSAESHTAGKPTLTWIRGETEEKVYPLSRSDEVMFFPEKRETTFLFSSSFSPLFRQKTRELAEHYNKESISALTNLLADFMGLLILLILVVNMKMSLMNTTAFLSESFFSLKDSKKAFLMLLFTDLLVGFHSPRGWEVIFHFLFEHFGLPENHNIIFLLVGTFPVLLDALFKYWIFRHLNRHSPATVATFQAMVE